MAHFSTSVRSLCIAATAPLILFGVWTPAWAGSAIDPSGASASGFVSADFRIGCSTCAHFPLEMSGNPAPVSGGVGSAAADVGYAGSPLRSSVPLDYTLGGGADLAATAAFEGALATPVLRARAAADNFAAVIPLSDPNLVVGIDLYNVSAFAQGVQRYTYVGSGSATYTFAFRVDGSVTNEQASVFASAGFYDDFLEVSYAFNSLSFEGAGLVGTTLPFDQTFTLSMTFSAGQSFNLKAALSADALSFLAYASADYSADAFNTLRVTSVTGGDTQLLLPSLAAAVPEPATWLLQLLGAFVLAAGGRFSRSASRN
jgi:hypothetical protein